MPKATEEDFEGEAETDAVRWIFTAPQTTFGLTLQFTEYKDRGKNA